MFDADARVYTPKNIDIMKVQNTNYDFGRPLRTPEKKEPKHRKPWSFDKNEFKRKYGIFLILIALFTVWNIALIGAVHYKTEKKVRQEESQRYAAQLEAYKAEQAQAEQAAHWLSGDASREAAINQAVDSVAPVIARLNNDTQKLTEVGVMLARVMNASFPNSFQEVASQSGQWPLYDGTVTSFSEHDRDLADKIVRPYMESGVIPLDLTANCCWCRWSENNLIARDSYKETGTQYTWIYHG